MGLLWITKIKYNLILFPFIHLLVQSCLIYLLFLFCLIFNILLLMIYHLDLFVLYKYCSGLVLLKIYLEKLHQIFKLHLEIFVYSLDEVLQKLSKKLIMSIYHNKRAHMHCLWGAGLSLVSMRTTAVIIRWHWLYLSIEGGRYTKSIAFLTSPATVPSLSWCLSRIVDIFRNVLLPVCSFWRKRSMAVYQPRGLEIEDVVVVVLYFIVVLGIGVYVSTKIRNSRLIISFIHTIN